MTDNISGIGNGSGGEIVLDPQYKTLLEQAGLVSFDAIWHYDVGQFVKKIEGRSVMRFRLGNRDFFLKRHKEKPGGISQGFLEFENIRKFRAGGLECVSAAAAGERTDSPQFRRSFLITESFTPFETLENLLRHDTGFQARVQNPEFREILVREIARFCRNMHRIGINHCDFNADHVLVYWPEDARIPRIAIYDLQRVQRNPLTRFRWIIKSLSEFGFSMPDEYFDDTDRRNLFLAYKEKDSPDIWDRFQMLWIRQKTGRIRRHTKKHPYTGDQF